MRFKHLGRISACAAIAAAWSLAAKEPAPATEVTSPKADSTYHIGQELRIEWVAEPSAPDIQVTIDISLDGGQIWKELIDPESAEKVYNRDQSYTWTIPESLMVFNRTAMDLVNTYTATDQAMLMLYEYDNENREKNTIGTFTIAKPSDAAVRRGSTARGRVGSFGIYRDRVGNAILRTGLGAPVSVGLFGVNGRRIASRTVEGAVGRLDPEVPLPSGVYITALRGHGNGERQTATVNRLP